MRKILLTFMSTLAAVITLFGYRTSTPDPVSVATSTVAAATAGTGTTGTGTTAAPPASTTSTGASTTSTGATTATSTKTVTGAVTETRWGPVQVQITVSGGKVTAATAVQVPSGNGRDVEINDNAVPVLDQETVSAQSADIDSVSGATYTSEGYKTSLQSALDQAGL